MHIPAFLSLTLATALGDAAYAGPPCPWYEVDQIAPGVEACSGATQYLSPHALNRNNIAVGDVTCAVSGTTKAWYWNGRDPMALAPFPPGTVHAELEAVSADGVAVGTLTIQDNFAFITDGVTTTLIETPRPANANGKGISSNGIAAGWWAPDGILRGFTWQDGVFTDHGNFGAVSASVEGVNAHGDMAGYRYFGNGFQTIAFVKDAGDDNVTDIVLPAPFWTAEARFINNEASSRGECSTRPSA